MMNNIIEVYYYIIKVTCDNGHRTYYKIGETNTKNRPTKLVEKYTALRKNTAEILAFEILPHNNSKRLNDKAIHANIDPAVLKPVDKYTIIGLLNETDGSTEFFELVDNTVDVTAYIKNLVASIKKSNYTANVIYDTELNYDPAQYHLVNNELLSEILKQNGVYEKLYDDVQNNILLIGQFDHDFIATIAMAHNITIWHDSAEQRHIFTFDPINNHIKYIDKLGELCMNNEFDIVIANPPYGKAGANITKFIIENIEYDEYINLLPANDYRRNDEKDLFKYVDLAGMKNINNGFKDAAVTTHLTRINKTRNDSITWDQFEISNYIDRSLDKYFYENVDRKHYAIDSYDSGRGDVVATWDPNNTIIIGLRDLGHGHLPYAKDCSSYKWNVDKSIDWKYLVDNHSNPRAERQGTYEVYYSGIIFNNSIEKDNFVKFMYSKNGFRFLSKIFMATNKDGGTALGKYLPKVDWTHEWTVEKILKDYNYSDSEILEIMNDLDNFKYMKD